ncbi:hypothetical protein V8E53_002181 [Lactarius tabidus]
MSFLSVEPQSRVFLENYSNTLLAQFDSQLSIIADRYLAFFQERRDIEATYVSSLRRLHDKAKTTDASFDPRAEPSTTRAAWEKVRDNLEKAFAEANAKQAFVDILDTDVITPLATFKTARKETKDAIRERIDGDLKKSAAEYADHAEKKISRLQAAYFKKYYPWAFQPTGFVVSRTIRKNLRLRNLKMVLPIHFKKLDSLSWSSEVVSDNDFRSAVRVLNSYRLRRAEILGDGYDCLEEFVFAPITKNVLVRYMDSMITASAKYNNLAMSTRVEAEKVLAGRDTSESNLLTSFRHVLSVSIPPVAFYCKYGPGAHWDSGLIFGEHLVDVETDQDNVPEVMRLCMEEVEKRGLDTKGIYSLRQRIESEQPFSFRSTDNIHLVAILLRRYLLDLPEPLFVLSSKDYRNYKQIRTKYPENNFSLLRTKIRELHPIHRATLGALLRHLLRVASHSDTNAMTVKELAATFRYAVLRGNDVLQDGVHIKGPVLEDLIRNVHTLFNDRPSTSPPVPSPTAETPSTFPSSSFSFSGAELLQLSEVDAMGPSTRRLEVVGLTPSLNQSSFSSLPSDVALDSSLTPSPTTFPGPLLGLPSSNTLMEGVDTNSHEQVMPEVRGMAVVEPEAFVNSPPPEVVSVSRTSVTEWRLRQSQLHPQPEAVTTPQSPTESVISSLSDLALSSVMSL